MSVEFLFGNFLINIAGTLIGYCFICIVLLQLKLMNKKVFLAILPIVFLLALWVSWNKTGPRITLEDEVGVKTQIETGKLKSSKKLKTDEERLEENRKLIEENSLSD